jgi:hypothetical protein
MDYANAKFLIYSCWESKKVAGSLLIDCALTKQEAEEKLVFHNQKVDEFDSRLPILNMRSETRIIYITNKPEWWTARE